MSKGQVLLRRRPFGGPMAIWPVGTYPKTWLFLFENDGSIEGFYRDSQNWLESEVI